LVSTYFVMLRLRKGVFFVALVVLISMYSPYWILNIPLIYNSG